MGKISESIIRGSSRIEVVGGRFDGLRGIWAFGPREPRNDSRGITIKGDDNKGYPICRDDLIELREIKNQ